MSEPGRLLRRLVAVIGAALLAMLFVGAPTSASPDRTATPTSASDKGTAGDATEAAARASLAGYPQMSLVAARAAAAGQVSRKEFHNQLAVDADSFGGAWFDAPSGVFHVAVT